MIIRSFLPFLQLHSIWWAPSNLLRSHILPICGQNCAIRFHLFCRKETKLFNSMYKLKLQWQTKSSFRGLLICLTNDLLIARLVSSSAFRYISWNSLFKAASPSSFSAFSYEQNWQLTTCSLKWKACPQNNMNKEVGQFFNPQYLLLYFGFKFVPVDFCFRRWIGGSVRFWGCRFKSKKKPKDLEHQDCMNMSVFWLNIPHHILFQLEKQAT